MNIKNLTGGNERFLYSILYYYNAYIFLYNCRLVAPPNTCYRYYNGERRCRYRNGGGYAGRK